MILHCVFCSFHSDTPEVQSNQILQDLKSLSATLDGVQEFEFGPNRDFEQKSQAFTDGFVIKFTDRAALDRYAIHPTHQKLGQRLVDLCNGGGDGIMVFDLETS